MTEAERAVMRFEEQYPRNDRAKKAAVRDVLGIAWVRYGQRLLQFVRRRDVLEEYLIVAHRVIRTTESGVRARAARTFAA